MPPRDQIINEDFELPAHLQKEADEVVVERETPQRRAAPEREPEFEFEIVDDTPEKDQGRQPLAAEAEVDEQHEEDLENYSEKVKKRINQMSHKYHDERRAKEQATREREEALQYAQNVYAENQRLQQTLSWGQQEYTKEAISKIDIAQQLAEDKYRKAYEAGDTEGTLSAQRDIANLAVQRDRMNTMAAQQVQQYQNQVALQQPQPVVYNSQPEPKAPTPDPRATDWASRNAWFGKDEEMTSLAYGLHQKLVNEGYDPQSDEYYAHIDSGIRQRFPEKFERPKKSSPVAPVGRTTATKKVTLTTSQVAIAKRLGVPLEVYAKHAMKEGKING